MHRREFLKIVAAAVVCPELPKGALKAVTKVTVPNYAALPAGVLYKLLMIRRAEYLVIIANEIEKDFFRSGVIKTSPPTPVEYLDWQKTHVVYRRNS